MILDGLRGPESHPRSFVKAVSWRIVGTLDTFIWSLVITHKPFAAASIASLEALTKILLYYGHERVWHIVRWTPTAAYRDFVKAVVWRVIGSFDTFILSLLVTGKLHYAVSIASIEALTKIALYYLHERAWRLVSWGLEGAPCQNSCPRQATVALTALYSKNLTHSALAGLAILLPCIVYSLISSQYTFTLIVVTAAATLSAHVTLTWTRTEAGWFGDNRYEVEELIDALQGASRNGSLPPGTKISIQSSLESGAEHAPVTGAEGARA